MKTRYLILLLILLNACSERNYRNSSNSAKVNNKHRIDTIKYDQKDKGHRVGYHKNDSVSQPGQYINGKKEGWHIALNPDGTKLSEGNYKNGLANGQMKWYHEGGHLAGEGLMKDGQRHGVWKVYAVKDGRLSAEVLFEKGKQIKVVKVF